MWPYILSYCKLMLIALFIVFSPRRQAMMTALNAIMTCGRSGPLDQVDEDAGFPSPVLSSGDEYRLPATEQEDSSSEEIEWTGESLRFMAPSPRTSPSPTAHHQLAQSGPSSSAPAPSPVVIGDCLFIDIGSEGSEEAFEEENQEPDCSRQTADLPRGQGTWVAVPEFPGILQRVGHAQPAASDFPEETPSPDEPSEPPNVGSDCPSGEESHTGDPAVGTDQLPEAPGPRRVVPEYLGPVDTFREALERSSLTGESSNYTDGSSWFSSPESLVPLEEEDSPSTLSDEATWSFEKLSTQDSWSRSSDEYTRPAPGPSSPERDWSWEEVTEAGSFDLDSQNTCSDEPSAY